MTSATSTDKSDKTDAKNLPATTGNSALVTTHGVLASVLVAVVVLHVAAALKHHFVLRDDVLRRMLPTSTSGQGTRQ